MLKGTLTTIYWGSWWCCQSSARNPGTCFLGYSSSRDLLFSGDISHLHWVYLFSEQISSNLCGSCCLSQPLFSISVLPFFCSPLVSVLMVFSLFSIFLTCLLVTSFPFCCYHVTMCTRLIKDLYRKLSCLNVIIFIT